MVTNAEKPTYRDILLQIELNFHRSFYKGKIVWSQRHQNSPELSELTYGCENIQLWPGAMKIYVSSMDGRVTSTANTSLVACIPNGKKWTISVRS